jgi:hypothetical protein
MKAMYIAFAATVIIMIGAYYSLNEAGFSAQETSASDAVRLGDAPE